MDGPSADLKFYDEFIVSLTEALISVGTCSLHVLYDSFKNGDAVTQWGS